MQQKTGYSYRNLDVWQDSQALAASVIQMVKSLPKDVASLAIAKQLVRAAGSAPANIAEGHGRFSKGAFRNHLLIARGSLCEVGSWIDLLRRSDYISAGREAELTGAADSLIARITVKAKALHE
jgi:four helix bundle protein